MVPPTLYTSRTHRLQKGWRHVAHCLAQDEAHATRLQKEQAMAAPLPLHTKHAASTMGTASCDHEAPSHPSTGAGPAGHWPSRCSFVLDMSIDSVFS